MNGLKVKAATHFVIVFAFFNQQFLLLGPPLPKPLACHQMMSWDTSLVVLGGDTGTSFSSSLHQLECKNGDFTWQTMETKMSEAKSDFVAFQVPDTFMDNMRDTRVRRKRLLTRELSYLDQSNVLPNKLRRRQ